MSLATDWYDLAECRGMDPELFFPEPGDTAAYHAAKKVCAECPVRAQCLDDAFATRDEHGIRGGMSAKERNGLRRRQRREGSRTRVSQVEQLMRQRGDVTAAEVAEVMGLSVVAASNALQSLVRRGAVVATPDPAPVFGGHRNRYRLVRAGGTEPDP